ncbi:hypothetical protein HAX54_038361 [Datura stramonium]|uniref:Uncharacterized protein n=1 Tax=Datura stramonium TaxID=4076 RepID=A0ABS8VKD4_DATST|nr:hypothetical protein [Datura stramonium]
MQGDIVALAQAHVELREELEKEKKKRRYRDNLLVWIWKGVKSILKHLTPDTSTFQATRWDLPMFFFLSGFEEGEDGDASSGSDESFFYGLETVDLFQQYSFHCSESAATRQLPLQRYPQS